MELRPYQRECLEAIAKRWQEGVSRQLVVLPTGSGKTVIAAHLPNYVNLSGKRLLFLVHLDELVFQAAEKFSEVHNFLKVGIEKASHRSSESDDIIVASVQSLRRGRISSINPLSVGLVFIDEAHHAAKRGGMYEAVLRELGALKGDPGNRKDLLLIGLTATPKRSDNIGLEYIFDEIVYQKSIQEMISEGWLTDIEAWRVWTQQDISSVKVSSGDFSPSELSRAVNCPARNRIVVDKYLELGQSQPAVAFTVDIKHSEDLAEAFHESGVPARPISGKMSETECHRTLEDFRNMRFQVLTSCMKISEGFDAPVATVALMARPTKSQLLYVQQLGRVLRPFPAPEVKDYSGWRKGKAIVIDFSDNSGRHRVICTPSLFGLPPKLNPKGKPITVAASQYEKIVNKNPYLIGLDVEDLDALIATAEKVSLFDRPKPSALASRYSKFIWYQQGENSHRLSVPDYTAFVVIENQLGQFEVWKSFSGFRTHLATRKSPREAFEFAEALVPASYMGLMMSSARWRGQRPSERQIAALYALDPSIRRRFRSVSEAATFIYHMYDSGDMNFSRGAISEMITRALQNKLQK